MWREEKIRFLLSDRVKFNLFIYSSVVSLFSFLLNAKLFAHNLATSQTFFFDNEEFLYKCNIYSLPTSPQRLRPGVRTIFIHCQSWFFDLFFICFKLNLQVLEREYIIKYAKMLFSRSALLASCETTKRNHFGRTENAQLSSACAFNYDVRRDGNLFSGQTQIFIFWSWFSILGSLQVHLLIRSCFSSYVGSVGVWRPIL